MIIGISGYSGAGKDALGKLIALYERSYQIKKFAGKLKEVSSILTGIPLDKFEDQEFKKSVLGKEWSYVSDTNEGRKWVDMTVREMLQRLGTEAIRDTFHINTWVNALLKDYKDGDNWVITDVRFANEAAAIKKLGGVIVRVSRGKHKPDDYHASEKSLDNWVYDYFVDNSGNLDELYDYGVRILTDIYYQKRQS